MIQFLSPLLGGLGSVISATTGLVGAGVKTAFKAMSSTKQSVEDAQEVAAQGTAAEESGGGDNGDKDEGGGKDEKKIKKSMFGGLDLANIKSQIDGPMGPPEPEEEVKGGVYKQIFAVNKSMLASLLGMEKSLKMLLSIEYERIQGMMSDGTDERQDSLDKAETDPTKKTGNKFGGLLGKAAGGIGGLLGSAYSKAKGGLGGNFGKLLGIGALIFAFKKYPDEVKAAFKKILTFLKDTFDYFTAEDFTFEKFKTDFVDKFFPRIKSILGGALDFLWSAIKGITSDFLTRNKGDAKIKKDTAKRDRSVTALKELQESGLDLSKATGFTTQGGIDDQKITKPGFEAMGIEADSAEAKALQSAFRNSIKSMMALSKESKGRISFVGFPDMRQKKKVNEFFQQGGSIQDVIDAVPMIDGEVTTMAQLKDFGLFKSAGVTKDMDEGNRKNILDNLSELSELSRMLKDPLSKADDGKYKFQTGSMFFGKEFTEAEALARIETLKAENKTFGAFSSSAFDEIASSTGADITGTTGTTANTKSLATQAQIDAKKVRDDAKVAKLFAEASMNRGGSPSAMTQMNDLSQTQIINSGLNGHPNNDTVRAVTYEKIGASY